MLMLWRTATSRFTGAPRVWQAESLVQPDMVQRLLGSTIASYKATGENNTVQDGTITSAI
eukprot:1145724-Pelagomonas_calceolata.AAC.1